MAVKTTADMLDDDKEVTDEELKQAMNPVEEVLDVKEEAVEKKPAESSPAKSETPAPTSEVVKSVTGEEGEKAVPYSRFKEVAEKAKAAAEYEEVLNAHKDKFVRNPITGKLEFMQPEVKTSSDAKHVALEDDLTDEDKLLFDEEQLKVIQKVAQIQERRAIQRMEADKAHREESSAWWDKAKNEFPEVKDVNSEVYKRANNYILTKYAKLGTDGKTIAYIPPRAHYLATLEAANEIRLEKERQAKEKSDALKDEEKNKKQQIVVTKKSAPSKTVYSEDEDEENMTRDQMDKKMKEEFNQNLEKLDHL